MILKNETIYLDGENSGIIVQIKNAYGNKPKFLTLENKPRLFNNIEVAKVMAQVIIPEGEFSYWILYNTIGNAVNINKCRYIKKIHTFQCVDEINGVIYNFVEKRTHKLSNLGYLIFDDGDVNRFEKEEGQLRQKELVDYITDIASGLLGEKWEEYGVSLIEVKRKDVIIHIKSTTTKIHIAFNSKIMDINQEKTKIPGTRRIPFLKNMDKYVTFYVFASKDIGEGKRIGGEEKAKNVIENIVRDLQEYYPETKAKLETIEFNKFIDLED